jgi:hypothetical protein
VQGFPVRAYLIGRGRAVCPLTDSGLAQVTAGRYPIDATDADTAGCESGSPFFCGQREVSKKRPR